MTLLVLFFVIGYGILEAWPLIKGPSISISFPMDNASFPGGIVVIRGSAPHAAQLTLDGAPIIHEENGEFSSTLTFPRGASLLTLAATDRFGRRVTETRTIFVP